MALYQRGDKPLSKSRLSGWMTTTHANTKVLYLMKHAQGFVMLVCVLLFMMTSSNGNIFRVTGPLCGEFTTQRGPVTRSFDVFFDLRLNKRLSKQPWGWWLRHRGHYYVNVMYIINSLLIHASDVPIFVGVVLEQTCDWPYNGEMTHKAWFKINWW